MRKQACRLALIALVVLPLSVGAQALLRRAERRLVPVCKTFTSGTAREMFELTVSSNVAQDRKEIWLQSMDVAYATNSIRISSFAATTDAQGWPHVGFADPFKLQAGMGVRIFVRRSSDQPDVSVCGLQAE